MSNESLVGRAEARIEEVESRFARMRREHRWLDHIVRAGQRYVERYGDHYAAAITYFSVLSLVPLVMVAVSIAGFVLVGHPALLENLENSIGESVGGALGKQISEL